MCNYSLIMLPHVNVCACFAILQYCRDREKSTVVYVDTSIAPFVLYPYSNMHFVNDFRSIIWNENNVNYPMYKVHIISFIILHFANLYGYTFFRCDVSQSSFFSSDNRRAYETLRLHHPSSDFIFSFISDIFLFFRQMLLSVGKNIITKMFCFKMHTTDSLQCTFCVIYINIVLFKLRFLVRSTATSRPLCFGTVGRRLHERLAYLPHSLLFHDRTILFLFLYILSLWLWLFCPPFGWSLSVEFVNNARWLCYTRNRIFRKRYRICSVREGIVYTRV